ncbi:MAG: DUF2007 domain-containing protein [Thermoleophilia bacterium]
MELCVAATAHDVGLASTIKGLLESAGIEAMLSGSGLESVYPGTALSEIRILVREADLPRALEVLDEAEAGALADSPDV